MQVTGKAPEGVVKVSSKFGCCVMKVGQRVNHVYSCTLHICLVLLKELRNVNRVKAQTRYMYHSILGHASKVKKLPMNYVKRSINSSLLA